MNVQSRRALRAKLLVFGILAGILILIGILAPLLTPNDPNATNALAMNQAPGKEFPFGTDRYGRCICSRVITGATTSIFSAVALVCITFVVGALLGMLAGWYGGVVDTVVMRLCDVLLSFPQMVLAIAVAGILGGGMGNAMLALGVTGWTLYARLARAQVLAMKEEAFVAEAKLTGCSTASILFKTLLPCMLGPLCVNAATQLGTTMIGIAGLSFLGIGVTEPRAEWGSMINGMRAYMQLAPWAVLYPAAATVCTVMVFNCLGESVRDALETGVEK